MIVEILCQQSLNEIELGSLKYQCMYIMAAKIVERIGHTQIALVNHRDEYEEKSVNK